MSNRPPSATRSENALGGLAVHLWWEGLDCAALKHEVKAALPTLWWREEIRCHVVDRGVGETLLCPFDG